jgi:putative transposase
MNNKCSLKGCRRREKMSQSLSSLLIHIIFSTKNRQAFIHPEIRKDLYDYMTGISHSCKTYMHEIGGIEDHVHLLVNLPRTLDISKLVEEIKKGSSKWIKTKGQNYKDFSWQNGYGAFSIGQSNYEQVRKNIQNQEKHHKKISFQDEFRLILKKYNIQYDEKYVWK